MGAGKDLTAFCDLLSYTYTPTGGMGINNKNMENKKQDKILISLKKASSLLSNITAMVQEGRYCIDIMQHNLAAIGLLRSAHEMLMENHLNTCFKTAMATKNEKKKKQMIEEMLRVTNLFNK